MRRAWHAQVGGPGHGPQCEASAVKFLIRPTHCTLNSARPALIASDYAAVQGFVLTMAILFVILNLFIDIIYTLVDPRVGIDA